ncbi:heparinase II/III domain-containing protein [Halomonas elongata]|uniref:heparinase II/III domain-containing protein n=1 Tax=Halomonas elongata TaxID=2746 RepID=UPI00186B95C2|nr:heparinase II/III family protein [Halomonas elongata]MBW5798989.1 heparinase II/III-family protein [Halomonas elongata]
MSEGLYDLKKKYKFIVKRGAEANGVYYARKGAEEIRISRPMQWVSLDRNVMMNLHAWRFFSGMWFSLFSLPSWEKFSDILGFIVDWSEHEKNKKHAMLWYDMATGIRACHLSLLLEVERVLGYGFGDHKDIIVDLCDRHVLHLADKKNITQGNHALHQVIGLTLLSESMGIEDNKDFCSSFINGWVSSAFDENYVNVENSPYYQRYNVNIISNIPSGLGGVKYEEISRVKVRGKELLPWMTDPHGNFYKIGATEGQGVESRPRKWSGRYIVDDKKWLLKDLYSSGYQFLREVKGYGSHFVFLGKNKSYTHAHEDSLSFLFYSQGICLLDDSGKYTYNLDEWRSYFISDHAHNNAGLKGVACFPRDVGVEKEGGVCHLRPATINDEDFVFEGSVVKWEGTFFHRRKVLIKNNGLKVVVDDWLVNLTEDKSEIRYHFGKGVTLKELEDGKWGCFYKSKTESRVASVSFDKIDVDVEIVEGREKPSIQGWISEKYGEKTPAQVMLLHARPGVFCLTTTFEIKAFCDEA